MTQIKFCPRCHDRMIPMGNVFALFHKQKNMPVKDIFNLFGTDRFESKIQMPDVFDFDLKGISKSEIFEADYWYELFICDRCRSYIILKIEAGFFTAHLLAGIQGKLEKYQLLN